MELVATDRSALVQFLAREAPWEVERLRSVDAFMAAGAEWAVPDAVSPSDTHGLWLRDLFAVFRERRCPRTPGRLAAVR